MGVLMFMKQLSKVSFPIGVICILGAFVLGWIGFSVPDWLSFTQVFSNENKFGLWSYCTRAISTDAIGFKCNSWSKANVETPDFLRTVQGLMTIGMVCVTAAVLSAILAFVLKKNILVFVASIVAFLALLFILIGIIVFAGDFDVYVSGFAGTNSWRRWGYWIFTAVIVLLIAAIVLLPFSFFYERVLKPRFERKQIGKRALKTFTINNSNNAVPNTVNFVPTISYPGYYREYNSAPSPIVFAHPIMPPAYEFGGRSSKNSKSTKVNYKKAKSSIPLPLKRSKEPKAIVREIIEPVYHKDPPAYNKMESDFEESRANGGGPFRKAPKILPGESDLSDEQKWDWEKVRK